MKNEMDASEQVSASPQYAIEEAARRAREGQSTPEDQALLAGFELGANEAIKSAAEPSEPTPAVDDLLGTSNRRIQQLDDEITTEKMWDDKLDPKVTARISQKETELKGHQDMAAYLKGRDFKDAQGTVHDATSGRFVSEGQANQHSTENDTIAYEDMPLVGLVNKWADAEFHNDRTMSSDVQDEIERRLEIDSNTTEEDKAELIDSLHARMLRMKSSRQETPEAVVGPSPTEPTEPKGPGDRNRDNKPRKPANATQPPDNNGEVPTTPAAPETIVATSPAEAPAAIEPDNSKIDNSPEKSVDEPQPLPNSNINAPRSYAEQYDDDQFEETPDELLESLEAALSERQNEYKAAAIDFATAQIGAENIYAGKSRKAALEEAGKNLAAAHDAYMLANDEVIDGSRKFSEDYLEAVLGELQEAIAERDEWDANHPDGSEIDDDAKIARHKLSETIVGLQEEQRAREQERDAVEEDRNQRESQKQVMRLQSLNELSKTVENEMLAQRIKAHPKLAKFNDWLAKHSKTRFAAGLVLTGTGFVGAATFNAPLVALSVAGKSVLRGYGSYNASRAVGEMIANRQLNRAQINDISDFLEVSRKQSTTRRVSKRAGAAVASVLSVVPAISRLMEASNHVATPQGIVKPSPPTTGTGNVIPGPAGIPRLSPVDGNMLPWTYGMDVLHTNISSSDVLSKLTNNTEGIRFIGNGLGGGHGAIESVTIPGQGTFSDVGHINAAISYVLEKG